MSLPGLCSLRSAPFWWNATSLGQAKRRFPLLIVGGRASSLPRHASHSPMSTVLLPFHPAPFPPRCNRLLRDLATSLRRARLSPCPASKLPEIAGEIGQCDLLVRLQFSWTLSRTCPWFHVGQVSGNAIHRRKCTLSYVAAKYCLDNYRRVDRTSDAAENYRGGRDERAPDGPD